MVPFAIWRQTFRVPWVRDNREAIHALSDMFYLLLALYRGQRFNDARRLQRVYFRMIESFALHGQASARETLERVMAIPWFGGRKRDVYRLIASYNHVLQTMDAPTDEALATTLNAQLELNEQVTEFVNAFKAITNFDTSDEARVQRLMADPGQIDAMLAHVFGTLD